MSIAVLGDGRDSSAGLWSGPSVASDSMSLPYNNNSSSSSSSSSTQNHILILFSNLEQVFTQTSVKLDKLSYNIYLNCTKDKLKTIL